MLKTYEPTYRMKPYDEKKFSPSAVQRACEEVVTGALAGKAWNGEEEAVWAVDITEQIKAKVRAMGFDRYKIVCQIVLGQNKQQGARVASRCLWDTETDNFASYTFQSEGWGRLFGRGGACSARRVQRAHRPARARATRAEQPASPLPACFSVCSPTPPLLPPSRDRRRNVVHGDGLWMLHGIVLQRWTTRSGSPPRRPVSAASAPRSPARRPRP